MKSEEYISRVIKVGNLSLGGNFPIRVQSMTSTNTLDTESTVSQAIRMIDAGCELIRLTAQGIKEANHLAEIKIALKKRGYEVPLIADIHYNPGAAEVAARLVEKVRINPGNYIDRKSGKNPLSDSEYAKELDKIRERIKPLVGICKQYGTVLRIGSNHGSLSERILFRYGDTPEGMVESALEFVSICEDFGFYDMVLSMKASNVKVMVQANRLLLARMVETGRNYPIHLGVTEAGDAEDGRMKSAAGIGVLLGEGIGDTIRVSLTEDPEFEIPVAKSIVAGFNRGKERKPVPETGNLFYNPFVYNRNISVKAGKIGGGQVPVVVCDTPDSNIPEFPADSPEIPDYLFSKATGIMSTVETRKKSSDIGSKGFIPVFIDPSKDVELNPESVDDKTVLVISSDYQQDIRKIKNLVGKVMDLKWDRPIILLRDFTGISNDDFILQASSDYATMLVDGLIDGVWLRHRQMDVAGLSKISFGILQASGARIFKTEYVACPSCGRTLFGIQETLKNIKSRTSHLKGLKIGVMGCCVNGPGEMADADYGYVGAGKGKITLYRGQTIVRTGIPQEEAVDALIELIKVNGDWK